MKVQNKDFIEIEFTGKTKEGNIFDSNIKENLQAMNSTLPAKPFVFCLGEGMFLKGVEESLIGKEIGQYTIELTPEKAFGLRDSKLVRMVPLKIFHEKQVNPVAGAVFNFDNKPAKILTVSGGRVLVDFNNPLAGKDVIYELKVLKKVEDIKEKIKALNEFLFRKEFDFEIKEKKLIINVEKAFVKFVEMFKEKYKDLFELELEVKQIQ